MRFAIQNFTPNPARARVTARLRLRGVTGQLPAPSPYSGNVTWHITPFFALQGVFDIAELMRGAAADPQAWLDEPAILSLQVDLYWPDRRLIESVAKEYHYKLIRKDEGVAEEFWPEVRPVVFGVTKASATIPDEPGAAVHGEN